MESLMIGQKTFPLAKNQGSILHEGFHFPRLTVHFLERLYIFVPIKDNAARVANSI